MFHFPSDRFGQVEKSPGMRMRPRWLRFLCVCSLRPFQFQHVTHEMRIVVLRGGGELGNHRVSLRPASLRKP